MTIEVSDCTYLKDPKSSELGLRIITGSIDMLDEDGFEETTFRRLGKAIGTTEASIYRYFENKHKLLLYLTAWYWGWMEYKLVFRTTNIESPKERLQRAISLLTEEVVEDSQFSHIDEVKLSRIVISESSKAYLNKNVDKENNDGAYLAYKHFVNRVSDIILEICPSYKYPHMLVTTVIEGAHHERFFERHLPTLTNTIEGEDSITEFYKELVFNTVLK